MTDPRAGEERVQDLMAALEESVAAAKKERDKKRLADIRFCRAHGDGDCFADDCPQVRDGEPGTSGRHCPLDTADPCMCDPEWEGHCPVHGWDSRRVPYGDLVAMRDRALRPEVVVTLPHDLCSALRSARERLAVAQSHATWPGHRHDLQTCIETVDRIGVFCCPDWSKYNVPTTAIDDGPSR